ncbi:MAG: sigma-70 family RNA polymerase sigma factor [Actinomycetota bacterium]|nr:sigma-70 family RNA polymerase sigma factor [Actinomycetota bacterium]
MHPGIDGRGADEPGAGAEPFEAFYEAEHDRLYRALYLLTGGSHEAEELMQETFVRVWERWTRRGPPDDPVAYLYRTAMNTFRMGYRRARMALSKVVRPGPPRDRFAEVDLAEDLRLAMVDLTPRQRQAIVLTAFLGYEPADAARVLGIRASTVRALTTQARAAIRDRIGRAE